MYAIIEIAGHQYKVKEGDRFKVNSLGVEEGKKIDAERVLMTFDEKGDKVSVGSPEVSGAKVELKVVANDKDKKVRVFKMKAKKRYRRNKGHRQHISVVEVVKISSGAASAAKKEADEVKEPAKKAPAKKAAPEKKED